MAKYVFGIDLGTTYSCIAYVDETGRATVVNNSEGTNTTPSVVNFASPSQVVVGQVAKENAVIDPDNTISLVKTLMGKTDFAISYNGEDKSPEEVSAYILRKVAEDAFSHIYSPHLQSHVLSHTDRNDSSFFRLSPSVSISNSLQYLLDSIPVMIPALAFLHLKSG